MTPTTSRASSLWFDSLPATDYQPLAGEVTVDVAVIGGGVAGLTAARLLRRAGATVAVLEAARLGRGVTGCTTAKVSALQGTIYSTVQRRHAAATASSRRCRLSLGPLGRVSQPGQLESDQR
jgi:glycine/D-amino acid oxidase-like deaminating enzyme